MSIEKYIAEQKRKYDSVLSKSSRGQSAYQMAKMSIEHGGSSSAAAAALLLSLEHGRGFNVQDLIKFDSEYRAHAELIIAGCVPHELWPSNWMEEEGYEGKALMEQIRNKWGDPK